MHGAGEILSDLVVVLAAALPIVLLFQKARLPSIVGFLIAGVLIGPHGLALIRDTESVEALAEIGIVLLLFVVGMELSFRQLATLGRVILWSCTIQILGTLGVVWAIATLAGLGPAPALLIGFLVTHSSTAIVLKLLNDRGEIDAPHGRIAVGILLVQDLSLVPMVLLTRVMGTPGAAEWGDIAFALGKAGLAVVCIILGARFLMPRLLGFVVRQRNRELFAGTIVLLCFGTAGLAAQFDLSLALGALLAGLVISESEYSHQIVADLLPFRDVLNSIFFISIGMLLQPAFFIEHPALILGLSTGVIGLKLAILYAAIYPFYGSPRVATRAALPMATMGELAFVLAGIALGSGLVAAANYDVFIAVAIVTMVASPFLMSAAEPVGTWLQQRLGVAEPKPEERPTLRDHVLIVGFGLNGENLTKVLRETGIPFVVLELNPERVAQSRLAGVPILYGDATHASMLEHAGLREAAVMVIAISDPTATRRIVAIARGNCRDLPIIVRTRYVTEVDSLERLGATEVIPEEFETSVEIFARVLRRLRVPRNVINLQIEMIRNQSYGVLRGVRLDDQPLDQLDAILARALTESFLVGEGSPACGRSIRELDLRHTTGVTILAVVQNGRATPNPDAECVIRAGDTLVLFGDHAGLDRAMARLGADAEDVGAAGR
jgi:CPA2 family monovalent cation:H+ antiporter-2